MNKMLKLGLQTIGIIFLFICVILGTHDIVVNIKHNIDNYIWNHSDHATRECDTEKMIVNQETIKYSSNGTIISDQRNIFPDSIKYSSGCLDFHTLKGE